MPDEKARQNLSLWGGRVFLFGGSVGLSGNTHLGEGETGTQTEHRALVQSLFLLSRTPPIFLTREVFLRTQVADALGYGC